MKYLKGFFQVAVLIFAVSAFSWATATKYRSLLLELDSSDSYALRILNTSGSTAYEIDTSGNVTVGGTAALSGDVVLSGTTPSLTIGDAGEEDTQINFDGNAQDFHIGLDDSADDLIIGLGTALGTTPIISMTDAGVTTVTGSTDGDLTIYGAGTTASDAYLRLIGDAGADAADRWQLWNDSSAGTLYIQNDTATPGTYVTKLSISSAGALSSAGTTDGIVTITGSGTSDGDSTVLLQADNSTDNGDDWQIQHDGATNNLVVSNDTSGSQVAKLTLTTGGVLTSGLGTVHTSEAALSLTASTTVSLTVSAGRQLYTDTITTDNEDQTINASGAGSAGDELTIIFTTDAAGSNDEVITFGTNFLSTGTLTLANLAADVYVVTFVSDGTRWVEKSRTTVQTT